jgi:hypothetical protein
MLNIIPLVVRMGGGRNSIGLRSVAGFVIGGVEVSGSANTLNIIGTRNLTISDFIFEVYFNIILPFMCSLPSGLLHAHFLTKM